jgi:hypothetical protein
MATVPICSLGLGAKSGAEEKSLNNRKIPAIFDK